MMTQLHETTAPPNAFLRVGRVVYSELSAKTHCLYRCRALAHALARERRQHAGFAIDAVGRQLSGSGAGRKQEISSRVEPERARDRLGRGLSDRGQPARGIDREAGNAV